MKRRRPEEYLSESEERALISSLDKLQARDVGCKTERVLRIACVVCGLLLVSPQHARVHSPPTTHPPTQHPPTTHPPPTTDHPPQVILMPAAAVLSRVSTLAHASHLKRGLQLLLSGGDGASAEVLGDADRCRIVPSTDAEDDHTDRRARRRLSGLGDRKLQNSANVTISKDARDGVGRGIGRALDEAAASEHDSLGRLRCLPNIMFIGASKSGTAQLT